MNSRYPLVVISLAALAASGCGWVDSTGTQAGTGTGNASGGASGGVSVLEDGDVISLNESSTSRVALADTSLDTASWTWRITDSDTAIDRCEPDTDFEARIATTQLSDSCTTSDNCNVDIEQISSSGLTTFDITLPVLKAPVALSFELESTLDTGETRRLEQTVCGIAINESPTANPDYYLALTSEDRAVPADSPVSVLSNDQDDIHVNNEPLFIKEITSAPRYADNLVITTDGGFRYTPRTDLNLANDDFLDDSIGIVVSDGVFDSETSITVRLVNFNTAPELTRSIPDYVVTVNDETSIDVEVDLAANFADIDSDPLRFRMEENDFTRSGALTLDINGVLSGTLDASHAGTDRFTVYVTDGLFEIRDRFGMTVRNSSPSNTPPEADDIPNTRVSGDFSYDVSVYFSDADGDRLRFSSPDLPEDVTMSVDGIISGTSTQDNNGRHLIRIDASDGRGGLAQDQFRLTIN